MEIDVAALQRLPEVSDVAGLLDKPRCMPNSGTKVICDATCSKTVVVILGTEL
jgi:hypothetical protein